jgi:uncharacterized protein
VLACALASLTSGCIVRSVEDRFIFFPTRELIGSPADAGLDYSDVVLRTDDGVRLHGWWVPAEPERAVVLFFHGNAGNISDRVESIRTFHDLDLSVFIVDYRGYGRSDGVPSEPGTYHDADAAWSFLTVDRGIAADRIVVFGRSLGGAVACDLATRHQPRALILESTFTSVRDMAVAAMPLLPVAPFLRTRYDSLSKIGRVHCPVLVIHSRDDEVVPFKLGQQLYEKANAPKTFVELRYGHNEGFILSGETYTAGLDQFLTEQVAAAPAHTKESALAAKPASSPDTTGTVPSRGGARPTAPGDEHDSEPDADAPPLLD